jgi:hypothetical protein
MMSVAARNRGPRVKRGKSRMRMGEHVAAEYKVSTLIQIVTLLFALGLLSVVAVTRYMDAKKDKREETEEAEAHGYIRALHGALAHHAAEHHLRGVAWVKDGEELMERLGEEGVGMPSGMRYADNHWFDENTNLAWQFQRASGLLPPRIRRVEPSPSPESRDVEPIEEDLPAVPAGFRHPPAR